MIVRGRARLVTRHTAYCGGVALLSLGLAASAGAQRRMDRPNALRGSKASVEKMYAFARASRLPFYLTPTNVDDAIARGRLVPLTGDSTYELARGVGFSYATKEAREFVLAFAPQYLAACGIPLTVTSAARPVSRQPHNANPHSVHPTGIAVDLRRPPAGPCLTWVRTALTDLERRGIVEVTEERHPVHLHVAVLVPPGGRVALPRLVTNPVPRVVTLAVLAAVVANGDVSLTPLGELPSGGARAIPGRGAVMTPSATSAARTYVVRQGDTLWDIANRTGVSVAALRRANRRAAKALTPGTTLTVPTAEPPRTARGR